MRERMNEKNDVNTREGKCKIKKKKEEKIEMRRNKKEKRTEREI